MILKDRGSNNVRLLIYTAKKCETVSATLLANQADGVAFD